MIRVCGIVKQAVDQLAPLLRVRVAKKLAGLLGGRRDADEIQRDAAKKLGVRAAFRRRDREFLQAIVDALIDKIVSRQTRVKRFRQRAIGRHGDARNFHEPHKSRDDDTLAAQAADADDAVLIHGRKVLFVGVKFRKPGHVANFAVGIVRSNEQGLLHVFPVTPLRRKNRKLLKFRLIRLFIGHPLADPVKHGSIGVGVFFKTLTALVLDQQRGLFQ